MIQQRSWVAIKGSNLATTTRVWATPDFVGGKLPTSLANVTVSINHRPASVEYVRLDQINVLAPVDSSVGPVSVTVSNPLGTSSPFFVALQPVAPAFFPWPQNHAVATTQGNAYIGPPGLLGPCAPTVPAKPGDIVTLWGTGFGPTNPSPPGDVPVPRTQLYRLTTTPTIWVGGQPVQYMDGLLTPDVVGLYQITVRLPASLPDGDLKLEVATGGTSGPDMLLTVRR